MAMQPEMRLQQVMVLGMCFLKFIVLKFVTDSIFHDGGRDLLEPSDDGLVADGLLSHLDIHLSSQRQEHVYA